MQLERFSRVLQINVCSSNVEIFKLGRTGPVSMGWDEDAPPASFASAKLEHAYTAVCARVVRVAVVIW